MQVYTLCVYIHVYYRTDTGREVCWGCGSEGDVEDGNSAAVHPVVLVNFIMQVSAISPSIYFMLLLSV